MSSYLIPESWTVPVIAVGLRCPVAEAQRLWDDGTVHDVETFAREAVKRDIERLRHSSLWGRA